jgi:hypothetical protein
MLSGLLGACAGEAPIQPGPEQDFAGARRLLLERAAEGPVNLVVLHPPSVLGEPPAAAIQVARLAAEGISAATVSFTADAVPGPVLVMAFDIQETVPAARLCLADAGQLPPAPMARTRLRAILCEGRSPVAEVSGEADRSRDEIERLIWRGTSRLFPDDYRDTFGFDLFGGKLRLGLGGSFGF